MQKRYGAMVLILFAVLAVVWGVMLAKAAENKKADAFAQPLYDHALPDGAALVQKDSARSDGVTTAALLLRTDATAEALRAFYSDAVYPPAAEGETVELAVKPLDESSLQALRQAGLYQEGASYWFVCLTSRPS